MTKPPSEPHSFTFEPIGVIRTKMRTKFDSPHQPKNSDEERNIIQLYPGKGFDVAIRDLATFDRIWLVWWFHKNSTWRPLVLPPRGEAIRRGVFATRSPHRPNPIGITAVPLLGVEKLTLIVGNTDLVDGTPILDIKPYVPTVDAFPDASMGWISGVEEQLLQPARYTLTYSPHATAQLEWLRTMWGINFMDRAHEALTRDPTVHRTRRIRKWNGAQLQMGCGGWRIIFTVNGLAVLIDTIVPGYPDSLLLSGYQDQIPDREAQIAFKEIWPDEPKVASAPETTGEDPVTDTKNPF
ncbi:MAG: tRNA ((37)-N6)-methyltransferase TrmO [Pseudomonadota bacterium]|jgi:tRNA-Thr(GGU) m(6)t(6)A37 methyltransferase TsaA